MKNLTLITIVSLSLILFFAACGPTEEASTEAMPTEPEMVKPEIGSMVTIPAGEFTMGSEIRAGNPPLAKPAHAVNLPEFEIDVYEVTNGEYARFNVESDYKSEGDWRSFYKIGKEDYPVANVTMADAQAYCEWAGKRLPAEAEWEKAARGPEGSAYPWGELFDWRNANVSEHGLRDTQEVGLLETDKSAYGLYDVMGNVQEWTSDLLKAYEGGTTKGVKAYNNKFVAVRGASYAIKGDSTLLWSRHAYLPSAQYGLGFRCAKGGVVEESAETVE